MELLSVELSGKLVANDRVTQSQWCEGLRQNLLLPGHWERADKYLFVTCDLEHLDRLSRELWRMVNSMSVTSSSPTKTISGRAEVTRVSSGMVATGFSLALIVLQSRCSLMDFTRIWRAAQSHAAKYTFLAGVPQGNCMERIWWMVGCVWPKTPGIGSNFSWTAPGTYTTPTRGGHH